jgi:Beta-lactamase enzyme family
MRHAGSDPGRWQSVPASTAHVCAPSGYWHCVRAGDFRGTLGRRHCVCGAEQRCGHRAACRGPGDARVRWQDSDCPDGRGRHRDRCPRRRAAEKALPAATGPPSLRLVRLRLHGSAALDPARGWTTTTTTTTAETVRLLQAAWTDTAATPAACARVRQGMAQQLTRHRIASGFGPEVAVAAKSGGLRRDHQCHQPVGPSRNAGRPAPGDVATRSRHRPYAGSFRCNLKGLAHR